MQSYPYSNMGLSELNVSIELICIQISREHLIDETRGACVKVIEKQM
jgi:hypothetical protein